MKTDTKRKKRVLRGQEGSRRFRLTRDRELWLVHNSDRTVVACFYMSPGLYESQRAVYCLPAVHGDLTLLAFLESVLRPLVIAPTGEGWLCLEEKIRLHGEKAQGITPSWYNKRPGMSARYADPEVAEVSPGQARFLHKTSVRAGLPDPHLVKTIFGWLSKQMLEDLLVNYAPVDLGFAWLLAVPYRPNWKEAMAKGVDFDLGAMQESRAAMYRKLTSLSLAGVREVAKNPKGGPSLSGFHWTLEVIPKPDFHRASALVEARLRKTGGEEHLRNWARIIWDLRPKLQQALEEYGLGCQLPVGTARKGAVKDLHLIPYAGSELLKKGSADGEPIVWSDGAPPVWTPEGEPLPRTPATKVPRENNEVTDLGMPSSKTLLERRTVENPFPTGYPSGDEGPSVFPAEPDLVPVQDPFPPAPGSGAVADPQNSGPHGSSGDEPTHGPKRSEDTQAGGVL